MSRIYRPAQAIGFTALLVLVCGCGTDSPVPEEPPDLESEYALEIKHKTLQFVEAYRSNPQQARDILPDVAESVGASEAQPTGEHQETYAQIAQAFQDLQSNFDQPAKVDELETLANKLPGDVEAYRQELSELED